MAKHGSNPQEVPPAAALHASWTSRSRAVTGTACLRAPGAPLVLGPLSLAL